MTGPHSSLSWVVVASAVAIACGSSTTTSVTAPATIAQRCQPAFDNSRRSFSADGGTGSVPVTVSRECEWSAATEAPWAVITSGAAGHGDGTVGFRIDRNPDPVGRNSALVIGGERLELAQQPAVCRFDVSRPTPTIGAERADLRIQITTHAVCDWLAGADVPWLTVAPNSGRGSGTVGVTVAANPAGPRSGSITVAGERLSLTQAAPAPAPPAPTPTPPAPPSPPPPPPPPPAPGPEVELSGRVQALSGACPSVRFTLGGTVVTTNGQTRFRHGNCSELRNGDRVEVKGRRQPDGSVTAQEVDLEDDDNDDAHGPQVFRSDEHSLDADDCRRPGNGPRCRRRPDDQPGRSNG